MGKTVVFKYDLFAVVRHLTHGITGQIIDMSVNRGAGLWVLFEWIHNGEIRSRWFMEGELDAVTDNTAPVRTTFEDSETPGPVDEPVDESERVGPANA